MMRLILIKVGFLCALSPAWLCGQMHPLESVVVQGSGMSRDTVMGMAGLEIGKPVDKTSIEAACAKLGESGLFQDVQYQYKQGPKNGYAVMLALSDQPRLIRATIDVPDVNEPDVWKWISAKYPAYDRRVPEPGAAQEYLARDIENHLGAQLHGHHIVSQMETDVGGGGSLISFHPDFLPQITGLKFVGPNEVPLSEIRPLMMRVLGSDGYMERRFKQAVELNLRGLYEQYGMYRVRFPEVRMERTSEKEVTVTTVIEEGPQYTLGSVDFSGEGVSAREMEKLTKLKSGEIANWREIDRGLFDAMRVFKATGYLDATPNPERVFDDSQHVLSLRVSVNRGPRYTLESVTFTGLTPEQEAKARQSWSLPTGAPYNEYYGSEFYRDFAKAVDVHQFKKWGVNLKRMPGHVVDVEVLFVRS